MTPTMTTLDAALFCADYGMHLIPVHRVVDGRCTCARPNCPSPGKHPVLDSWQTSASTDLNVLRDWFVSSQYNVGVVCGASDLCVIDVDPRNGGDATLAALTAELGALPTTVTADSGGGGAHYVFRRPPGDLLSKLGPGVDLLHGARQFLIEPSLHHSGGAYRWRIGPDEASIATLTDAWVRRVTRPAPKLRVVGSTTQSEDQRIRRAAAYLARLPPAVSGQSGHNALFNAVACVLIGFDLSQSQALALITNDYNPRCDPPWNDRELEHKIRSVNDRCQRERGYLLVDRPRVTDTASAVRATPPATDADIDWRSRLLTKTSGAPRRGCENVAVFVRYHPDYAGRWAFDEMTKRPWFDGKPTSEVFVHEIRGVIDRQLGFSPPPADVEAAILLAASERPFHPIRQYLRSIDWDGVPRLQHMAAEYLGTREPLHAEMVAKFMIGAAARALRPGCKLDTTLMLVGKQGRRKSTFFQVLGGAWHADSAIDINSKDGFIQLHAAWIYELAELENVVTGRGESRLKAWLTSSHDTFRAPFARTAVQWPRTTALCGTTNREQFVTDDTGSRRFWIVPIEIEIPWQQLAANRDQLWAEAVCAVDAGTPWWLDAVADTVRERANDEHAVEDVWAAPVVRWLHDRLMPNPSTSDILNGLGIDVSKQGHIETIRVGRIMRRLGWEKFRASDEHRTWRYRPPD